MKKSLLAILLTSLSSTAFSAVLLDEKFEGIEIPFGFNSYFGGNTFIASGGVTWLVGGNGVDLIDTVYGSPGSPASVGVDLNYLDPGKISTNVAANTGLSTFTLSFDYWGNGGAGKDFEWKVGSESGSLTSAATALSFSKTWTASEGSSISISFESLTGNTVGGGTIDNIRLTQDVVSAVPEPGEWAMMLAGLGVVSAIAKRRKKV
jgi:hypothetical protein